MQAVQLILPAIATAALGTALLVPLRDDRPGRRATIGRGSEPLRPQFPGESLSAPPLDEEDVPLTTDLELDERNAVKLAERSPTTVVERRAAPPAEHTAPEPAECDAVAERDAVEPAERDAVEPAERDAAASAEITAAQQAERDGAERAGPAAAERTVAGSAPLHAAGPFGALVSSPFVAFGDVWRRYVRPPVTLTSRPARAAESADAASSVSEPMNARRSFAAEVAELLGRPAKPDRAAAAADTPNAARASENNAEYADACVPLPSIQSTDWVSPIIVQSAEHDATAAMPVDSPARNGTTELASNEPLRPPHDSLPATPAAATPQAASGSLPTNFEASIPNVATPQAALPRAQEIVVSAVRPALERVVPLTRLPLRPQTNALTWPPKLEGRTGDCAASPGQRHAILERLLERPASLRFNVIELAYREEDATGRALALRVIARHFAPDGDALFREALRHGSDEERSIAIDALAASGLRDALTVAFDDRLEALAAKAALAFVGTFVKEDYRTQLAPFTEPARIEAILKLLAGVVE